MNTKILKKLIIGMGHNEHDVNNVYMINIVEKTSELLITVDALKNNREN